MAVKTTWTDEDPRAFVEGVTAPGRRRDALRLLELMQRATGVEPRMFGSAIVGFGAYHYRYASGHEGDAPAAGFSPRKAASVVYLNDGIGSHEELLARLGPHTTGVGCLYLKDLTAVDLEVLEEIVRHSYATLTGDTYGKRAAEGGDR
ncbi:DUF1801 domain-containing protein [Nocardioides sp. NPDC057577]|uniref:DUF1801 domain-containing protein n=1 Tax=Nocardioides sp. NPDC057577 TaxID=3346171 RepID=UPI003670A4EC